MVRRKSTASSSTSSKRDVNLPQAAEVPGQRSIKNFFSLTPLKAKDTSDAASSPRLGTECAVGKLASPSVLAGNGHGGSEAKENSNEFNVKQQEASPSDIVVIEDSNCNSIATTTVTPLKAYKGSTSSSQEEAQTSQEIPSRESGDVDLSMCNEAEKEHNEESESDSDPSGTAAPSPGKVASIDDSGLKTPTMLRFVKKRTAEEMLGQFSNLTAKAPKSEQRADVTPLPLSADQQSSNQEGKEDSYTDQNTSLPVKAVASPTSNTEHASTDATELVFTNKKRKAASPPSSTPKSKKKASSSKGVSLLPTFDKVTDTELAEAEEKRLMQNPRYKSCKDQIEHFVQLSSSSVDAEGDYRLGLKEEERDNLLEQLKRLDLSSFPDIAVPTLVRLVQGSSLPLSQLAEEARLYIMGDLAVSPSLIEEKIKVLAERKPYGVKERKVNVYEDNSAIALWRWEVALLEVYSASEVATIKKLRTERRKLGAHVLALHRLLKLLSKDPVDEAKVSEEEAKVAKFERDLETLRARRMLQEQKLKEKLEAQEAKKIAKENAKKAKAAIEEKPVKEAVSLLNWFNKEAAPTPSSAVPTDNSQEKVGISSMHIVDSELEDKAKRIDALLQGSEHTISEPLSVSRQQIAAAVRSASRLRRRKIGKHVVKFLQFHDNYRPAYYGTWKRRSAALKKGRRPLYKDTEHVNYEVDSDEEWEEEEPGESISDSDCSEAEDNDVDGLDWDDPFLERDDALLAEDEDHRCRTKDFAGPQAPLVIGPIFCMGGDLGSGHDDKASKEAVGALSAFRMIPLVPGPLLADLEEDRYGTCFALRLISLNYPPLSPLLFKLKKGPLSLSTLQSLRLSTVPQRPPSSAMTADQEAGAEDIARKIPPEVISKFVEYINTTPGTQKTLIKTFATQTGVSKYQVRKLFTTLVVRAPKGSASRWVIAEKYRTGFIPLTDGMDDVCKAEGKKKDGYPEISAIDGNNDAASHNEDIPDALDKDVAGADALLSKQEPVSKASPVRSRSISNFFQRSSTPKQPPAASSSSSSKPTTTVDTAPEDALDFERFQLQALVLEEKLRSSLRSDMDSCVADLNALRSLVGKHELPLKLSDLPLIRLLEELILDDSIELELRLASIKLLRSLAIPCSNAQGPIGQDRREKGRGELLFSLAGSKFLVKGLGQLLVERRANSLVENLIGMVIEVPRFFPDCAPGLYEEIAKCHWEKLATFRNARMMTATMLAKMLELFDGLVSTSTSLVWLGNWAKSIPYSKSQKADSARFITFISSFAGPLEQLDNEAEAPVDNAENIILCLRILTQLMSLPEVVSQLYDQEAADKQSRLRTIRRLVRSLVNAAASSETKISQRAMDALTFLRGGAIEDVKQVVQSLWDSK